MRPLPAPWLPVLVVMSAAIGAAYAHVGCAGCIDRNRVNKHCEWMGDTAFPIQSQDAAHQKHLVADAQLAEDLAIRYADAEFDRLYGYEAHGGLIDNGRVVKECMARLVAAIENNHAVTSEQIAIARGQRNRLFDITAALSFAPLYLFGATVACRRLARRFSSDSRSVRLVAASLASIAASFLGLQFGQLWGGIWEAIRVGNGHMSMFRAATHNRWGHQHVWALFVAGILAFWLIAVLWRRVPWSLTVAAAMLACTMLGAMFVDVFVQHAVGYAVALLVLLGMIIAVSSAGRFGAASAEASD